MKLKLIRNPVVKLVDLTNRFWLFEPWEREKAPLVVCYGAGRDSTAMLVGYWLRGIRPDLILFADTGSERQATYDYLPIMNAWLKSVGFPEITVVRYQPQDFKHWPPYESLEENILTNRSLASIAYGSHTCSAKWKIAPCNKYIHAWIPALNCWGSGQKVDKAIGFDASPRELRRSTKCSTFAVQDDETDLFNIVFPLQQWGWTLDRCIEEIPKAGLPVPFKSSCYFCTAMKPWEVDELARTEPDKLKRIVVMEARTAPRHLDYAQKKGWPRGVGVPLTEGIWRKEVKGFRGAIKKPGSMTEYIREKGLLPSAEIDRIIAATPTDNLYQGDIQNWQSWLNGITNGN